MIRRRGFDISKSNVSAELKVQFQENSTLQSDVKMIPGVGSVTEEKLKKNGMKTVGDLVKKINSFKDLEKLVTGVNRHRIFDCLECYLKEKCPQEYDSTEVLARALEDVSLVDRSQDELIAENVMVCTIS